MGHHNNKRMAMQLHSAWLPVQHGHVAFFIFHFFCHPRQPCVIGWRLGSKVQMNLNRLT